MPARDPQELFSLHDSVRSLRPRRKSRIRLIALSIISLCFVTSVSLVLFSGVAEKPLSVVNANLAAAGSLAPPFLDRMYPWFGNCEQPGMEFVRTDTAATTSPEPEQKPVQSAYTSSTTTVPPPPASESIRQAVEPQQVVRQTVVTQPVIERVVERERVVTEGGVSETTLADRLNQLENKLRSLIFSQSSQQSAQTSAVSHAVALSQRIDNLSNTTITNPTITGGSITASSIVGTISSVISSAIATVENLTTTELVAVNATFTNATTTTFYAGALGAGTASITNASTTNLGTANLRVSSLDCTGYANGGTLTTDGSGNVICATDDGGAGSTVAGSDMQVQFNSGGGFAAAASFTFASSSGKLAVPYASTTALSATILYATTASTTNLIISGTATTTAGNGFDIASGCFSINGTCLTSGSAADGTFSTTSADYWDTMKWRWATTSSDWWLSQYAKGFFFSTTSADWWKSQSNFFSTSSANAWEATQWRWATTSAAYFESTFSRWATTSASNFLSQNQALAFSTTSANAWDAAQFRWATTSSDYWKIANNFFSTTSVNAWEATQTRWATTSSAYFLSQNQGAAFSTTSVNYWESTQSRWATTSTAYWDSLQFRWATTSTAYWESTQTRWATSSSDYWQSQRNFFSTTSVDAWDITKWRWSTSSSDYAVNTLINSSSTIARTTLANLWTPLQTFAGGFIGHGFLHRDRPHDARRRSHTAGHHRFSFVHKFYRRRDRHHYARRELRRHRLHYPRRHPEGQRPRVHPIRYRRHRLPRWLRPLRQLREVGTEQHARRRALSVRFRRRLGWRHMGHDHAIRIRPAHQSSALYDRYRHDRRHRHELDDIRLLRSQYADRLHQRLSRHRHHLAVHKLSVAGDVLASRYAATSSLASIFPYASSTAFTATSLFSTTASTTNLTVSGFATSTFNGGINLATGCFSLNGTCITSGSAADGTFSTTSADHWDSTKGRWATSSANYWESTQTRWATSSSDYWLAQKTTDNIAEGSNLYFNSNRVASVIAATTTDALPQGTTNKYYSTNLFAGSLAGTTTDALREGSTNFYFTNNRVASVIAGTTTTALAEGANKYYTDQRADTRINATSSIGTLTSAPNLGTLATTLSGFLKATAGVLSTALINLASDITGVLPVGNGGTGWSNIAASAIPYGNGSSALATTSAGTAGYVLAYLGGVPTWTATTTFSAPLSYSGGAVSIAAANGGADGYLSSTDWNAFNTKFATTSSDYWLSQYSKGFFFSTTSADAWDATRWRWSTSSSDFAVNAFISSSTTIPKTFAANSWTALQTFANGFISNASSTFTTGLFSMNGGASTTNFSASGNVVLGNATTTALFATTASTTNLFGAGLSLCQGGNVLTWASGRFGCAADQWGAAGSAWPFTPSSNYGVAVQSTSTPVWATAGLMASSTSYFVNASSTALTVSGTAFFGTATSTTDQDVSRLHGQ